MTAAVALIGSATGCTPPSPVTPTPSTSAPSTTVPTPTIRHETAVASDPSAPAAGDVVESAVSLYLPMPAGSRPHPPACDWLSYLRYRHRGGPADAARADRILVAQPGIFEGASAFDSVARNTIVEAARLGKHIEMWALDRRSNCLEDHTGVDAAYAAGDPKIAVDYYYRHRAIEGRTFPGYLTRSQTGWLADVGLDQTLRDQYDVMRAELPDPRTRSERVWCGGHSLGGVITGFFASWDFDGNPATTADAGYRQCAGYFALDTLVTNDPLRLRSIEPAFLFADAVQGAADSVNAGLQNGDVDANLALPVGISPETMNLLAIAGAAAAKAPDAESQLARDIPAGPVLEGTYKLLFSRNLFSFLTGAPSVRDFRFTNQAALGALMDDNSVPLSIIQASVGFFDGGPVAEKNFPFANDVGRVPGLEWLGSGILGAGHLAIPSDSGPWWAPGTGPVYRWRNYDRVGAADDPTYRDDRGVPFTNRAAEVTDIGELARSLAAHPLDFTEQYFPTRLQTDITLALAGAPRVATGALHPDGVTARPTVTVLAGDGPVVGLLNVVGLRPAATVVPGYQHLDVLTAAGRTSDGSPEPVSHTLAEFVSTHGVG